MAMFGFAVLLSLASAWWSFGMIEREVSRPFQAMSNVLRSLREIKRGAEDQATLLLGPPDWTEIGPGTLGHGVRGDRAAPLALFDPVRFDGISRRMQDNFNALQEEENWRVRAGQYAAQNLHQRIRHAQDLARRWGEIGDDAARESAGRALFEIHELIELIEGRILDDAYLAGTFERQLRDRLLVMLAIVVGVAMLVGLLTTSLVDRWIVRPLDRLRIAAERIGEGEFSYRVEAKGHDELARLAREVNQMAELVERMQEDRVERERLVAVGQMMRRLAHNIRNPLAGIRGLAEMTRHEVEQADLKESQRRIIESVDRFEEWLNRLLRATSPADIEPRPTQVLSWLRGVLQAHDAMASAREVRVECDLASARELNSRSFDPDHLGQALAAILANAIEATPRGGRVWVQPGRNEADGSWSISVTDEGPGIPEEVMPHLFRPSFTTKKQGTGIGLASALHATRGHGGWIEVESLDSPSESGSDGSQSHGARFTLVLPGSAASDELANNGQGGVLSGHDSDR